MEYRIGVDTLGSESPSRLIVQGVIEFARANSACEVLCIGRTHDLAPARSEDLAVIECEKAINQHDSLVEILRSESSSSMHVGLNLLAEREIDAFVSTGNTAALMALGRHTLPMLPGWIRPAIIKRFEGKKSPFWILDLGANIARKRNLLLQFAYLGTAYAKSMHLTTKPRVAVLNIGAEAHKGPEVLRRVAVELSRQRLFDFVGFIEADLLFDGFADVVVTDGFSGNIMLKSLEGAAKITHHYIREALDKAALSNHELAESIARNVNSRLNSQSYNGASLIGLDGVVIKSHGHADNVGIEAALKLARDEVHAAIPKRLKMHFQELAGTTLT